MGVPQNGLFIMENNLLKWMIWGYPHDLGNIHMDKYHENMVFWGFTEIDWRFNGRKWWFAEIFAVISWDFLLHLFVSWVDLQLV